MHIIKKKNKKTNKRLHLKKKKKHFLENFSCKLYSLHTPAHKQEYFNKSMFRSNTINIQTSAAATMGKSCCCFFYNNRISLNYNASFSCSPNIQYILFKCNCKVRWRSVSAYLHTLSAIAVQFRLPSLFTPFFCLQMEMISIGPRCPCK